MSATTNDDTFNSLKKNYEDAITKKQNYSYGYKPLPIQPITTANGNKITITPVGTFTPKRDGTNALNDVLYRLPLQQTADTCIANAAALKTNFVKNDVNPAEVGGTFTQQSKMQKYSVASLNKNVAQEKSTQKYTIKFATSDLIIVNGLNFRVYDRYSQNDVDVFKRENTQFSINTRDVLIPSSQGQFLPTNFSDLRNATKTNCTNKTKIVMFENNKDIQISNISELFVAIIIFTTGSGFRQVQRLSVTDIIRQKIQGSSLNIPAQDFKTLFQFPDIPEINITAETILQIAYSESMPSPYNIQNNVNSGGGGVSASPEKHQFMVQWEGLFKPNQSGNWQFWINSDDDSFLWIGNETDGQYAFANNANTIQNATINNGGLHGMREVGSRPLSFIKDKLYHVKLHFAENGGGYNFVWRAMAPDGTHISSSLGELCFSYMLKITEEPREITKENVKDVISYSTGAAQEQSVDLGAMYNKKFSTIDPDPVYVSLVYTPETKLFDCYMTNPANAGKKAKMNEILNDAANIPILNTVAIWTSNEQGSVYEATSMTKLDDTARIMLDGTIPISVVDAAADKRTTMPVPDETHYLYITEVKTGEYFAPTIYVYNATNKTMYKVDLQNNKQYSDNMNKYKLYQRQNLEWRHANARCLAAGDGEKNTALGVLYKITPTDAVVSVGQMFRLIMQNGRLTLEMSINAEKISDTTNKHRFISRDIADNTHSIMKVDVRGDLNQLNLYQKDKNALFMVPRSYAANSQTYTEYKDIYPYLPPADTTSTAATKQECETACNADAACNSYYSFSEGGQTFCKKINTDEVAENPTNLGIFNSNPPPNRNISNSSFYMKNRKIADEYNTEASLTDVNGNNILPAGTVFSGKTYYPNAPEKNAGSGSGFDALKYEIGEKHRIMFQYLNDPTNFKMADLENVEKATQERIAAEAAAAAAWEQNLAAQTQTEGFSVDTDCNLSDYMNNNTCLSAKLIKKSQEHYNTILEKDRILKQNQQQIKNRVANLDQKFVKMSDPDSANLYHYDFNGFDDSQEKSIIGAITRDTNEILLHQNTLYIVGTITTAAFLIGAIVLARGGSM